MRYRPNLIYKFMQACFWMLYCCFYGYATYYLICKGMSTTGVGLIISAFGLLSAVLQPALGRLADRTRAGWKLPLMLMTLLVLADGILLRLVPTGAVQWFLFGIGLMLMGGMMPLINACAFISSAAGEKIDFAPARGVGSFGFAIFSLLLGKLTVSFDEDVIVTAVMITAVVFLAVTALMKDRSAEVHKADKADNAAGSEPGRRISRGFLRKYPAFFVMWVAGICLMTFHNMSTTYLIQICESIGGDSNTLGIAHAIAAMCELPVMFGYAYIRKYLNADHLMMVAGIAFIIKAVMYVFTGSLGILYLSQVVQMFSYAVYASNNAYYAEESMSPEDKATGQAFMSNSQTIGCVIGSMLGAWIISFAGLKGMLIGGAGLTVLGTAAIFVSYLMHAKSVKN